MCIAISNFTSFLLTVRGSFAMVISATRKDDPAKKLVAIKLINMEHFDQLNLDRVSREIEYVLLRFHSLL